MRLPLEIEELSGALSEPQPDIEDSAAAQMLNAIEAYRRIMTFRILILAFQSFVCHITV